MVKIAMAGATRGSTTIGEATESFQTDSAALSNKA